MSATLPVGQAASLPHVILLLAALLLLTGLGERELYSSHEARAAMDAASLLRPESDGVPRLFDGRADTQKPPLYYWLAAGFASLVPMEWAVRLPAALSGLGVVALLLFGCRAMGRPMVGVIAASVLLMTPHFPWLARIGRIDMPLAFTTTAAGFGFALRERRGFLWMAWLACAAGVLLKGPVGLLLPGAVVVALLLAEGKYPAIWEWKAWKHAISELELIRGFILVLLITLPVFLWMEWATGGGFLHDFLWLHNVQRGLGGSRLRAHPWWHYGPYLLLYLLPFSPLLLAALIPRWWKHDSLARLGLAWLCGTVALLSAARFKRADYLLPAYPGAAIFLGCLLERWVVIHPRLCAALLLAAMGGWALHFNIQLATETRYRDYRPLAALAKQEGLPVVLFRAEAHALAYRLGRAAPVLVEWEDLREALARPTLLILPPEAAEEACRRHPRLVLLGGTEALAGGRHERPLLLFRAGNPAHAAAAEARSHR